MHWKCIFVTILKCSAHFNQKNCLYNRTIPLTMEIYRFSCAFLSVHFTVLRGHLHMYIYVYSLLPCSTSMTNTAVKQWRNCNSLILNSKEILKHKSQRYANVIHWVIALLFWVFSFISCIATPLVELTSSSCICSCRRTLRMTQPNWGNWITSVITYLSWGPSSAIQQTNTWNIYL